MTDAQKLVVLKKMYGGSQDDGVLQTYLDLAAQIIINRAYPFKSDVTVVPAKYEMNQIEVACYLLNKIGAEGETAHNENGINRTYESASVPESMLKDIIPHGGVL